MLYGADDWKEGLQHAKQTRWIISSPSRCHQQWALALIFFFSSPHFRICSSLQKKTPWQPESPSMRRNETENTNVPRESDWLEIWSSENHKSWWKIITTHWVVFRDERDRQNRILLILKFYLHLKLKQVWVHLMSLIGAAKHILSSIWDENKGPFSVSQTCLSLETFLYTITPAGHGPCLCLSLSLTLPPFF